MSRDELVLGGFGGQGIILAGFIVGQAASIFDGKCATFTQDYGPEARGGSCRAQVVISDTPVSYPYIEHPAVLVVMSQEAYTKYTPTLRPGGILIIDSELVKPDKNDTGSYGIAATRIAREMGRVAVANIVMLGFLTAIARLVSDDSMKKSLLKAVPKGTEELNTKAFDRGYACGVEALQAKSGKKA